MSLRYLLETLGTEWGRNLVDTNIWTAIAEQRYHKTEKGMIIKDVRFENEVRWLDLCGGILFHVLRPNFMVSEATVGHPSNNPLPIRSKDMVIMNDSSLDVLSQRVHIVMDQIILN